MNIRTKFELNKDTYNLKAVPYKEREIEKKYYSIGEVASMFKVAPSLIRYWEGEFDIIKPKKDKRATGGLPKMTLKKSATSTSW